VGVAMKFEDKMNIVALVFIVGMGFLIGVRIITTPGYIF
jgi:hypothetical protein